MKITAMGLFFVLVLATASGDAEREGTKSAQDVEVSGKIVDGLDRPVPGATVTFSYYEHCDNEHKQVVLATFMTDEAGCYAGVVHNWPESVFIWRSAGKDGYEGGAADVSSTLPSGLSRRKGDRFDIWRKMPFEEAFENLSKLEGDALDQYVLEVLASQLGKLGSLGGVLPDIENVFFRGQGHLLQALRKACANPHVGDRARAFLEFFGELHDPHELESIEAAHRSTPKIEVSAPRLNDAVQAVAEAYHLFWEEGEEIYIDETVFTMNYEMALIRCHVYHGPLAGRGFKLRFEKTGAEWVLKAFVFDWLS